MGRFPGIVRGGEGEEGGKQGENGVVNGGNPELSF